MSDAKAIANKFKVNILNGDSLISSEILNGFAHPLCSVITNQNPGSIENFSWGLLPPGNFDPSITKFTLNARIETLREKSSFRNVLDNRCLVIADGYYEWMDEYYMGKKRKARYLVSGTDGLPFVFAGLYSVIEDKINNGVQNSFTIITTKANELVSKIHSKGRMPVIIRPGDESKWLYRDDIEKYAFPYSYSLSVLASEDGNKKRGDFTPSLF